MLVVMYLQLAQKWSSLSRVLKYIFVFIVTYSGRQMEAHKFQIPIENNVSTRDYVVPKAKEPLELEVCW